MTKYDEWPSMQDFTFQEFSFRANRYEMWEAGRMIRSGSVQLTALFKCNGGISNRTSIDINLSGNPLPQILMSHIRYDRAICLPDRIMFYTTAENTNVQNTTLVLLASNVGYTRENKFYEEAEPVVASVFTINKSVVKISFSLANPDRLIEFYYNKSIVPTNQFIRELVSKIANLQSEAEQNAIQKGDENLAFGTYHSLESYKMPLYYAWEAYNYGHHKDLSDIKEDPLMSFSIFESDMVGITKQLINLLETKKSPINKLSPESSLSDDLISLYSTFVNDLVEGNIVL